MRQNYGSSELRFIRGEGRLSFVRNTEDLAKLQGLLDKKKSKAKIIAKIENQEGLDNIHDISRASWGVMVARGDLGIETSLVDLPNIQRRIMYAYHKSMPAGPYKQATRGNIG